MNLATEATVRRLTDDETRLGGKRLCPSKERFHPRPGRRLSGRDQRGDRQIS